MTKEDRLAVAHAYGQRTKAGRRMLEQWAEELLAQALADRVRQYESAREPTACGRCGRMVPLIDTTWCEECGYRYCRVHAEQKKHRCVG